MFPGQWDESLLLPQKRGCLQGAHLSSAELSARLNHVTGQNTGRALTGARPPTNSLHTLPRSPLSQPRSAGAVIIPILQMGKLRLSGIRLLIQGHVGHSRLAPGSSQ